MITNAFKTLMSNITADSVPVRNINGQSVLVRYDTFRYFNSLVNNQGVYSSLINTYPAFIIGKGLTPPTVDDYTLEDPITSGFNANLAITYANNKINLAQTLTNTTSESITISEVGFKIGTANGNTCIFLVDRTLLDKPVTIAPNETKTIQYSIDFNNM